MKVFARYFTATWLQRLNGYNLLQLKLACNELDYSHLCS